MRIGFDAKRAFYNFTGLGNYSRSIINLFCEYFPDNGYYLYVPRHRNLKTIQVRPNQNLRFPGTRLGRTFHPLWRSCLLSFELTRDKLDIFHGLSNELPWRIDRQRLKTVVTIHDLIFMRYPRWYPPIDRRIYLAKSRYSCDKADRIIAISRQTRSDLTEYLRVPEEKIDVVYQTCDPVFTRQVEHQEIKEVLSRYDLPSEFILYVGTIEERKNLLTLVQAIESGSTDIPLVVVGRPTQYAVKVKQYIARKKIENIIFLENLPASDLPALYQNAALFIYPSTFEGFGLPILEALYSRTPVITTNRDVFREAGGEQSVYIDPENIDELSDAIKKVLVDTALRKHMIEKGYDHAQSFNQEGVAKATMEVYKNALEV